MGVTVGPGVGEYNDVDHVNNGEEVSEVVLRRPSINLENRTDALKDVVESNETAIGTNATAISNNATAIGDNATAIGTNATAIAANATAIATNATAIGTHQGILDVIEPLALSALQPFPVVVAVADFTAETDKVYVIEPTLNTMDIQLPEPKDATVITIKDMSGDLGSKTVTILRHGSEYIDDKDEDLVMTTNYQAITLVSDGTDWFIVKSGGGSGGGLIATFFDPLSTSLPTGSSVTIDGVLGENDDLVLFTNLTTDNNRVYKLSGVGSSITWTPQALFNGLDPLAGHSVKIQKGEAFNTQEAVFNGTNWVVNDVVRLFTGADFWEMSSLKTLGITDNTTANVFNVNATGSENIMMSYAIKRGGAKEAGYLMITHDGTTARVARPNVEILDTGVDFIAYIDSGNLKLDYISDDSGSSGTLKYFISRWSDSAGGPTGIPNYSNAGGGTNVGAGGNLDEIQFHGAGGTLDGDPEFKWDASDKSLNMNGMKFSTLSGPLTLLDNQTDVVLLTFPVNTFANFVIEYSIGRDGDNRTGRILIAANASGVGFDDSFVETNVLGVTLAARVVSGNVELIYSTTSTGNSALFKHSTRKWV